MCLTGDLLKPKVEVLGFSNHDCATHYRCPCCKKTFDDWTVYHNEKNDNGTKNYCPHCKCELNGL